MYELNNFESIQIGLASSETIREWSRGEVTKPETINYRTLKPERDGLFCERIFGPQKDWECHCGKYKRIRYKGIICDRCGVEVTRSKVRREWMGHIELAAPVSHIWFFKGIPSRMGLILDISPRLLEKVLYFAAYIVLDPGETPLEYKQVLQENEYREYLEKYGKTFKVGMGAEAIQTLLTDIDIPKYEEELRKEVNNATGQKRVKLVKRLDVVVSFNQSGNKPEWMILNAVPVIPPDLRPMVQLDGGRFATSDLNDLYRRVINRNNRLKRLLELGAPDIIVRNEKRMLQEAVDALIDNGRHGRPVTGPGNRPLKSLSDFLSGKQGRFRQNLLGKRVDYSGRSVIVVGPELKMHQCGLPKGMALELFKPFVMKKLVEQGLAFNIKSAKRMVEKLHPEVWAILEEVIKGHPVLLNRAPTLHRLGIQAFEPVLVEGKAIKLHPLACEAYNADFDGDQMAVHVPLSMEAQAEARFMMLSTNNILKLSDGQPVVCPSQDMIIGSYYLTAIKKDAKGTGKAFNDIAELLMAYDLGEVSLHAVVKVRVTKEWEGKKVTKLVEAGAGRFIFNEYIPQDLGIVDRTDYENLFDLEIDSQVDKKMLAKLIDACYRKHGATKTCEMLDEIKAYGFHYSTRGAITVSVSDIQVPEEKWGILDKANVEVHDIHRDFKYGLISDEERYESVIDIWTKATDDVTDAMQKCFTEFNPIRMMADSGARGNISQIRQLAGMRGLTTNPSGGIIELPIRANFREGLTVLEFFISTHGTRKGLSDTALRTADSGYLTRRLVDVSHKVIIRKEDCFAETGERPVGIEVSDIVEGNEMVEPLIDRIIGRFLVNDLYHPTTGELLCDTDTMISRAKAEEIVEAGIKKVKIRSVLTCHSEDGVCAKCYGNDMATGKESVIGAAVGIIAAQSIGEPGTQLTMRTFHTGGVVGDDITRGLPRVEELFEARKPKGIAIISEISGILRIQEDERKKEVVISNDEGESKTYLIPYGSRLKHEDGAVLEAGDTITEGSIYPHDLLKIKGVKGVQQYLTQEVQKVYRFQGIDINDKHIEVIVKQMLKKVKIEDAGGTDLLPGILVNIHKYEKANKEAIEKGLEPATASRVLLGITKASLTTESFLSAASFQETTKMLMDASIKGKTDKLLGLKENILLGKLIPAGTGMKRYKKTEIEIESSGLDNTADVMPNMMEGTFLDDFSEASSDDVLIGAQPNDIIEDISFEDLVKDDILDDSAIKDDFLIE